MQVSLSPAHVLEGTWRGPSGCRYPHLEDMDSHAHVCPLSGRSGNQRDRKISCRPHTGLQLHACNGTLTSLRPQQVHCREKGKPTRRGLAGEASAPEPARITGGAKGGYRGLNQWPRRPVRTSHALHHDTHEQLLAVGRESRGCSQMLRVRLPSTITSWVTLSKLLKPSVP